MRRLTVVLGMPSMRAAARETARFDDTSEHNDIVEIEHL